MRNPAHVALAVFAALAASAQFARADEVDASALTPWTYTDGSSLAPMSYLWLSGCVRSGQYERPVEISADAAHTYKNVPDAVCYFRLQATDVKGERSKLSDNEGIWDGINNRVIPPAPTTAPTGDVSSVLVPTATWSKGFNFRQTAAFVVDGANEIAVLATDAGWKGGPADSRDRDASAVYRPKLSGLNFIAAGVAAAERVWCTPVPAAGNYAVRMALGDATSPNRAFLELRDGPTVRYAQPDVGVPAGMFIDATGVRRDSAALWLANNAPRTVQVSSGQFCLALKRPAGNASVIAHLSIARLP